MFNIVLLVNILFVLFFSPLYAEVDGDGVDDYIDSNNAIGAVTDLSWGGVFTLQATPDAEENIMGVFDTTGSELFQITFAAAGDLSPECYCGDNAGSAFDSVNSSVNVTVGTPFSVLCTMDIDGEMKIYLNGVETGTLTLATSGDCDASKTFSDDWVLLSRRLNGTPDTFTDIIVHEAYVFDKVVSAQEAVFLNSRVRRSACQISNLLKYLPLDDVADGTSADADSFRNECGSDEDAAVGVDGANNTGLTALAENYLSYPE